MSMTEANSSPPEADGGALLSSKQMAKVMGVSTVTLSRWRCEETGPPFIRLSSRRAAYPVAYCAWVEAQTVNL